MKKESYTTLDVYAAAYLKMNGLTPMLRTSSGKVVFSFPHSSRLLEILERYNNNLPVPVQDFTFAVKSLRGAMIQTRAGL